MQIEHGLHVGVLHVQVVSLVEDGGEVGEACGAEFGYGLHGDGDY